ncbi:DUF4189 domain-containing protein [Sphingopyxis sp.]|uniref:DUF4189 domain-containing protein n=1 Tax=Sphingopyxis sp. TaxID=1908224 RepID=UPI003D113218
MKLKWTVAALAALTLTGAAAPGQPRYAALVEDLEGGFRGFAVADQASRADAEKAALAKCGQPSCEVVLVFSGRACGSFHRANDAGFETRAFGWATEPKLTEATAQSLKTCSAELYTGESCVHQIKACNSSGGGEGTVVYSISDTLEDEEEW